ncbi:MAG: ATP-binding protein [Cyanobacteriota bacterium]|nr:ATP-binding protein [Cyanobacteriota bacterium]
MEILTVPGNLESLSVVAAYVLNAAQSAGLDKKQAYKLRLAVDELVTNIIVHGYQEKGLAGEIQLAAQWDASSLSVRIEDTGHPYDPTRHSLPQEADLAQSLIQRPHGGLGIYLALDGVDELRYERVDDRNRSVLTVNL